MLTPSRQIEAGLFFSLGLISFALFFKNDPWSYRDGVFLEFFVAALPYFVATPTLHAMSLYVGWNSLVIRILNLAAVVGYVAFPLTREYAVRLFKVAPLLWGGIHH